MKEFSSMNDILDFAIQSEQEAVDFYTRLSASTNHDEMRTIFVDFAREEMNHKAKLLQIKSEGVFHADAEKVIDLKIADYMVSVIPKPDMKYDEALVLAMQKEKAAFKLYTHLAEKAANDDLKSIFYNLAQEESKHKLRFELEYDEFILKEN